MAIFTAIYSASIKVTGSWVDVTDLVLELSGSNEATRNADNALSFGDSSETRISVRGLLDLMAYTWEFTPFKAEFGMDGPAVQVFNGVITARDNTLDDVTFTCEGFAVLAKNMKEYSRVFVHKPVATKTTASSVEDPDEPAYAAGPINWILWKSGGRPVEQDFSYPDAAFYYSCDRALIAPRFAWIAGENGWDEALKLVQASGGQLFQAADGTITYRQPYTIADNAPGSPYLFTTSAFKGFKQRQSTRQLMTKALCSFIPRFLRPTQDVAEDTTSRLIPGGETITFDIEPTWPLYNLEQASKGQLAASCFTMTFLGGRGAVLNTDYTHTLIITAQRISLTIENLTTRPMELAKVVLRGQPITAGEAGSVSYGSGTAVKEIASGNPYIQSALDGERLCQLYMAFYGDAHPLRTLSGCVYNPDRVIGEIVELSIDELGLSAVPHVIVAIRHSQTGAEMEVDLVEIEGIHKTSDFFIVGRNYTGVSSKLVGY
ncbi:MAG: hypothetical protein IPP13_21670 [Kouleothrix sp.]|jgi:hypothetical protein|nr:hypothetical protein [Kouleothrix sp.]